MTISTSLHDTLKTFAKSEKLIVKTPEGEEFFDDKALKFLEKYEPSAEQGQNIVLKVIGNWPSNGQNTPSMKEKAVQAIQQIPDGITLEIDGDLSLLGKSLVNLPKGFIAYGNVFVSRMVLTKPITGATFKKYVDFSNASVPKFDDSNIFEGGVIFPPSHQRQELAAIQVPMPATVTAVKRQRAKNTGARTNKTQDGI